MSNDGFDKQAQLLNVMANANRLRMLSVLLTGEISVGPLADQMGLSQSALSQHLSKLRAAELVGTRRDAQTVYYSVKSERVGLVLAMLEEIFGHVALTHQAAR
jgi:DNA-binding transcriptional ArsR family regulator